MLGMTFGKKYHGLAVEHVVQVDIGYCKWLLATRQFRLQCPEAYALVRDAVLRDLQAEVAHEKVADLC